MVNGAILNLPLTQDTTRKKKRCLIKKNWQSSFAQALTNLVINSITIDEKVSFQER